MENVNILHRCGQCLLNFETEQGYLDHVCDVYGQNPTHPRSMGENYLAIQTEALTRGASAARDSGDVQTAQSTQAHIDEINQK